MKILFIDHQFHTKTKSSNFFLKILADAFGAPDIEHVDVQNDRRIIALEQPRKHDIVIIWQLDFLAPAFLAAGYRTVVIPMYDGSANMPFEHWLAMTGASFLNFSRTLHERVSAVGARSHLVRYYLRPHAERELPKFDELRAILWMRRPEDGLTPRLVENMIGADIVNLHVHNSPDSGSPTPLRGSEYSCRNLSFSESKWHQDSNEYLKALDKANVFVAPRLSEGIGLTMLEAFARGLLVLANDDAVHNEYIANWTNGILFNPSSNPFHINLLDAKYMAYNGWKAACLGYEEWMDNIPTMLRFIAETPDHPKPRSAMSKSDLIGYWDAYTLGIAAYRRCLRNCVVDVRDALQNRSIATPVKDQLRDGSENVFSLDDGAAYFGTSPNTPANKFGFNASDAMSASVDALSVGFQCLCPPLDGNAEPETLLIYCRLEHDTEIDWIVLVHVDGRIVSRSELPQKAGDFILEADFMRSPDPLSFCVTFVSKESNMTTKMQFCEKPPVRFFACDLKDVFK